jgi:hypothetical protein
MLRKFRAPPFAGAAFLVSEVVLEITPLPVRWALARS